MKNHQSLFERFRPPRLQTIMSVGLLLLLLLVQQVDAGLSNTIPKYGFLPGVNAYAMITSLHSPESSNGWCQIQSYTSPFTNINVIGWTWWQCERKKDNLIIQAIYTSGSVKYGAPKHEDGFIWTNAFTGGVNKLKAHGVHDFNHNGSTPSPWRPYNVNVYP